MLIHLAVYIVYTFMKEVEPKSRIFRYTENNTVQYELPLQIITSERSERSSY